MILLFSFTKTLNYLENSEIAIKNVRIKIVYSLILCHFATQLSSALIRAIILNTLKNSVRLIKYK